MQPTGRSRRFDPSPGGLHRPERIEGRPDAPEMPVIAIDGPAGSGKSTVARLVAQRLGFTYLDSGAMYRAVGVVAQRQGLSPNDGAAVGELAGRLDFRFESESAGVRRLFVNGEDLTRAIRTRMADEWAAAVAGLPEVRRVLISAQRRTVGSGQRSEGSGGWVVEGRDMQTVAFPEAELKVFLTASLEERAKRRLRDIQRRGEQGTLEEIIRETAERDRLDETRALGPLRKAADAEEISADGLSADEVAERIVSLARQRLRPRPSPHTRQTSPLSPDPSARHPVFFVGRALWRAFFTIMGRWRIYGRENVPASGGVILAPNHVSYVDPPLAGSAIERKTWFMAKSELFRIPVLGPILPKVCAFPVKRGTPDREALRNALNLLAEGQVVVVFPEGTRSPDGNLQKPELGIGLLALRSGAPVVPVAFIGSDRLLPRGSPIPRFAHVTVRIGQPLRFARDDAAPRQARERVAGEIMSALARLIAEGH